MLQVDHIFPFALGGQTAIENSQTLCKRCNGFKGKNEIDFRIKKTHLKSPKDLSQIDLTRLVSGDKNITESLKRVINFFYNCSAVYAIAYDKENSDKYLSTWGICLFKGNEPNWLIQNKLEILEFIHKHLGCPLVKDIKVINRNY